MTTRLTFPPGFHWGAATAAYQIEGAADEDGRGPSIWDTFCREPGKVLNGDTGDVATDHYHRLEADLDLMTRLSLPAYRFSVSWPRVIPDGAGKVNQVGLDFYERLVDGLLKRGIEPLLTLYHWDLPQALQDEGGWLDRRTVDRFVEYAEVIGRALGDRVPNITTLNEPFCSAFLGHALGTHAPGIADNAAALAAAHHLNLAHGRAVTALRSLLPSGTKLSITLNVVKVEPASDSLDDQAAADHVDAIANRIFLEPILRGRYPDRLRIDTQHITDWSFVRDGDLAQIAQPIDVLGVNYYSPTRIAATPRGKGQKSTGDAVSDQGHHDGGTPWAGTDLARQVPQDGPQTDMGWVIDADAFTALLLRLSRDYPEMPLIVTENGCAYDDSLTPDRRVPDTARISYLTEHLAAVHQAIERGADVRGYYVWSLLDNFEWAWGYSKRFGVVYVDYQTLERIPKDSALWFARVVQDNAVRIAR